jgi:Flp pilus assembly protein TadD
MRFIHVIAAVGLVALVGCASGRGQVRLAEDEARLGVAASQKGFWQEAHFRFDRARALRSNNAEILNNLAVSLEALGRYDEALTIYKRALEIAPKDVYIRRNYSRFAEFFSSYARGVKPKGGSNAPR